VFARGDQSKPLTELRSVTREERHIGSGTDLSSLHDREIEEARRAVDSTPDHLIRAVGLM
jgi:hypothetical protein